MSQPVNESDKQGMAEEKKYFLKVLDDVVSLNSLFTMAVFIGLSFALPGQVQSLSEDSSCQPNIGTRKRLVAFEITSFSCFVFSGIMAKTVKMLIYIRHGDESSQRKKLILVPFYFSIYGTMCGCFFLLLAMVDVIEVKLGRLSCGSKSSLSTVMILILTIGPALLAYFASVTYGVFFTKEARQVNEGGICLDKAFELEEGK
ncbi:hypothetical protein MLD38_011218 [Melastoma candidum]|uniref:Uncharacterized protein n=1 Tax=Melastoma candidum TaxID=119954 RepID=A0ACB9R2E8_9MYRT|nr:hypothetical protein MLD38_011218 [Melastoma candidum]